jgi:hypothetical protein
MVILLRKSIRLSQWFFAAVNRFRRAVERFRIVAGLRRTEVTSLFRSALVVKVVVVEGGELTVADWREREERAMK